MRQILLSKNPQSKAEYVQAARQEAKGAVIHIHPENTQPQPIERVYRTTYEALNKTEVWLHVNSLAGQETTVILENPTRYPKISSPKFKMLQRLSFRCGHLAITDIVPFTLDIQYLYGTYSYLGRGILGYSHYYAWRENYQEMTESGEMLAAHDHKLIASKVKSCTSIDYTEFLTVKRETVRFSSTDAERSEYEAKKAELFEAETNPQRIVTRLADHAHAKATRTNALLDLVSSLQGDCLLYCNLGSYATRLNAALKKAKLHKAQATSYATADRGTNNLIFVESPIVKSYLLLDAEARGADAVYHMLGDLKVDLHLYNTVQQEITQINDLTKELYRATH